MNVAKLLRSWFTPRPARPKLPDDPRLAADPWLGGIFGRLGDRYRLAEDGARVLRRTGRARFNPMPVWVISAQRLVRADYEVRGDAAAARALLDQRVSEKLTSLGLSSAGDAVEDWAGSVLTRKYEGRCDSPDQAAAAVRFVCEESETQINLAAE
ncbi:MAG: hypothetical protein ABR567_19550 [Myxococcales bacterium]|nr:hypothetical protein [Myxococcales bacterium]